MTARFKKSCWLWAFLLVFLGGLAGCASVDTQNRADTPWNAPKNWENGLPTGIFEGR